MSDLGPYARVYQSIRTDPRFEGIYESNELLGAWLRLLLHAESEWPESPAIPRSIPDDILARLVDAGIVELHAADTYRIHGLDPERERRSEHGRGAINRRWHPENTPSITPSTTDSNTQPILAPRLVTSTSSLSPENVERAVPSAEPLLDALMESQGSVPSKNAMEWAERLSSEYGEDATIRALGWAATTGPVKVISRAESHLKEQALRRERSDAKRKAAELEQARSDRIAARRADLGPADPRPLSEILKGLTP